MKRRHLHPVIETELVREGRLLDESEAREVHRTVAHELSVLSDVGLIQRARQVAEDFKAPSPHRNLSASDWSNMAGAKFGDVQRQVFDLSVIGGPRQIRQARAEIERAIGLLLVLDDRLRDLEDQGA